MATVNVSAIAGDATPFVMRGEDLGSGTADSVAGKVVALHRHDAIYKAAWDSLYGFGLTKNFLSSTVNTSGDSTLVDAPGSGSKISVAWLRLANESATETTVLIKSSNVSTSTQRFRAVLAPKETAGASSIEMTFPVNFPLEMAVNEALVINLSDANTVGYSIGYFVKS